MTTLLNLDTNRNEIVNDTNYRGLSPSSSSHLSTGGESDSRFSTSSSPASEYNSPSDSTNVFKMDSLNITGQNMGVTTMETDSQFYEIIEETDPLAPYLEIIEQPIDKFRFRYKSEMHGTHGSLTGWSTNKVKKSFPSVHLHNFDRSAIIQCSLFQTDSIDLFHHSHSLVVRKGNDDIKDPHNVEVSKSRGYTAVYQGMGIIHTAKKFIVDELHEKLVNRKTFEISREVTSWERAQLRLQAEKQAKHMNLNQVCLCFEAFELVDDNWVSLCEPVLSIPINNMKSALTGELKITRLSSDISEAGGGEDLFLFVEKVGKKNIKVRFYETDENDEPLWEDWGLFSETDVHHQYAIALRTPPYKDKDIDENVECWIQLVRPTDKCYSDPIKFRYKPRRTVISRKRARMSSTHSSLNNSAELPAILNNLCEVQTISKEYNKSGMIDEVVNHKQESFNSFKEDFDKLLNFMSANYDTDDLISFIDPNQLMDSKELGKDSNKLPRLNDMLVTDSANAQTNKPQNSEQFLLLPLMHKIMLRNSKDVAADKIKSLFDCEYQNDRCVLDFLITSNAAFFKYFLNVVVQNLGITEVLNYQNNQKKSCFHMVCEHWDIESILEIIPTLIRLGVDPNLPDDNGDTVLHVLIKEDNLDKCVNVLLKSTFPNDKKLNLDIRNNNSLTPLLLAVRLNRIDIVGMLLDAGASITEVNSKDGNNLLHTAVTENSEAMVELLLNRYKQLNQDVEVTRKNNANQIPIELAMAANPQNSRIIKMLMRFDQPFEFNEHKDEEDDSEKETSDTEIDCSRFQQSMNFLTNDYSKEIKTEPLDESDTNLVIDENQENYANTELFDEICLDQLCELFNRSDKWRKLATFLDVEAFVNVWAASKNPSKMMFKFSEVQGTELRQIIDIFKQLNESSAVVLIDEMIARRLENDD